MAQTPDERRESQRLASKARRDRLKAAGAPAKGGPPGKSGPSGGQSTAAERQRRLRAKRKDVTAPTN